jgi:hypothetical protein
MNLNVHRWQHSEYHQFHYAEQSIRLGFNGGEWGFGVKKTFSRQPYGTAASLNRYIVKFAVIMKNNRVGSI